MTEDIAVCSTNNASEDCQSESSAFSYSNDSSKASIPFDDTGEAESNEKLSVKILEDLQNKM